ncbi:MAG: nucleotide exchange factor GrpE [Mangrovibacterium sp.]
MTEDKKINQPDQHSGAPGEAQTQQACNQSEEPAGDSDKTKKAEPAKETAGHPNSKKSGENKNREENEMLKKEIEEIKDKHIRLQAEFDNFRRRTLKEKMELLRSAGETVLTGILPVVDDIERALVSFGDDAAEDNPYKQGVTLIYNKFRDFLKQNGIREIETYGHELDTDLHEAITKIPAPEEKLKGKIVDVVQKGYLLNDKVIRFAKVVIGE